VVHSIQGFVLEAIHNLEAVWAERERAGATISGYKSVLVVEEIKVVAYVCDCHKG